MVKLVYNNDRYFDQEYLLIILKLYTRWVFILEFIDEVKNARTLEISYYLWSWVWLNKKFVLYHETIVVQSLHDFIVILYFCILRCLWFYIYVNIFIELHETGGYIKNKQNISVVKVLISFV